MDTCLSKKERLARVVTLLNREEIDFLDKLSKDALFSTGIKLSRTQILRSLVEAMRDLNFKTKGIKKEENLTKRIIKAIENQEARNE